MKEKVEYLFNRIINGINFSRKHISYPKSLKIYGRIRLACNSTSEIEFGENVLIRSGWKENPAGGGTTRTLLCVGSNGKLKIGSNSGISNSTIVCQSEIMIGKEVNIGVNCVIYDTDHHSVEYTDRIQNLDSRIKVAPVIIDDGAWIGGHCIILKGVHIGKRSVIAAGSVVCKSVPDDELWGGNPARYIKKINQN